MNNKILSLYDWFLIVGVIASNIIYSALSGNVDIVGSFGLLPSGYDLSDKIAFKKIKNTKTKTINQSLHKIGDKMGLPFNLHIHLGRHTYAMLALNGGVDIKTTSTLLGHASSMVTEKVYATLLPNTIAEVVGDKLNIKLD